jgi:hypothetical protein
MLSPCISFPNTPEMRLEIIASPPFRR